MISSKFVLKTPAVNNSVLVNTVQIVNIACYLNSLFGIYFYVVMLYSQTCIR